MSNSFAYNVLTTDGAVLIALATAANPLTIVSSKTATTAAESASDLASKPLSWYDGRAGEIVAVSATDATAKIIARYGNEGQDQIVKTVCVTAKLASQNDSEAVILCAKSDPDSQVEIPGAGRLQQFVEFPFNININGAGTVEVTPGASASIADLDRFISCHKAGDPTQGEAQNVLGSKTFDDISANTANIGEMSVTDAGIDKLSIVQNGNFETKRGTTITIDDSTVAVTNGADVTVSGGADITISGSSSDITISGGGDITINGLNFNYNAGGLFSLGQGAGLYVAVGANISFAHPVYINCSGESASILSIMKARCVSDGEIQGTTYTPALGSVFPIVVTANSIPTDAVFQPGTEWVIGSVSHITINPAMNFNGSWTALVQLEQGAQPTVVTLATGIKVKLMHGLHVNSSTADAVVWVQRIN